MNAVVLKELQAAGKQGGLSGIEIIEGVVLTDEEWTSANVSAPFMPLPRIFPSFCLKRKDKSNPYFAI